MSIVDVLTPPEIKRCASMKNTGERAVCACVCVYCTAPVSRKDGGGKAQSFDCETMDALKEAFVAFSFCPAPPKQKRKEKGCSMSNRG